jgi:hypothetical protein
MIQCYSQSAFNHDKKDQGLLKRINLGLEDAKRSMDESRQLLEKEKIESKKLNPQLKKKMDDFLDSKKHLERREELAKKAFKVGFFDDAKGKSLV